jgi:hypothetical protein
LMTYSTTCTELEARVNKSFSDQGCTPVPNEPWPMQEARAWKCGNTIEVWGFSTSYMTPPPSMCVVYTGTCAHNGAEIKVFAFRSRYGRESCDPIAK